jgi:uncharacterized membrane protein
MNSPAQRAANSIAASGLHALLSVKLSVMLARLLGTLFRVRSVTLRGMRVMGGLFVRILFMMLGRLAMMLRGMLVMFSCLLVVFYYLLLGHGRSLSMKATNLATQLNVCRRNPFLAFNMNCDFDRRLFGLAVAVL